MWSVNCGSFVLAMLCFATALDKLNPARRDLSNIKLANVLIVCLGNVRRSP